MNEEITADKIEEAIKASMVNCDNCKARILPELIATPTAAGGEYQHFVCSDCGEDYPVATISAYGLRLRGEIETAERLSMRDGAEGQRWAKELATLRAKMFREVKKRQRPEAQ